MVIVGKNYYGTVCVYPSYNVTITYDHIRYSGPQISYNRAGTCRYIDSAIDITTTNGNTTTNVQELGEVHHVVFGGNVTVNHSSPGDSLLWFLGTGCTLEILPYADVAINVINSYMIYSDGGQVSCTVGKGASLSVSTKYGVFFNSDTTLHQFGRLTIEEDAAFEAYQSVRNTYDSATATIKVKNGLVSEAGARFTVLADYASARPLVRFTASGVGATFTDPDTVLLSNATGKLFDWSTGSGTISIDANVVDYWTSVATLQQLSSFSRMPDQYWSKANGDNLTLAATASGTSTTNVTSNFVSGLDQGSAPTTASFNLITARMISFGRMPIWFNEPSTSTRTITGFTSPDADLQIFYDTANGSKTMFGSADPAGGVAFPLPEGDYLVPGTLSANLHSSYKIKTVAVEVLETIQQILAFQYVPEYLLFHGTNLANHTVIVPRQNPDWSIGILDTRGQGAPWSLYASVPEPLTSTDGKNRTLPDAIVHIDQNNVQHILNGDLYKYFSGTKGFYDEVILSWPEDQGIFVVVEPGLAYADMAYTATIRWILADVP